MSFPRTAWVGLGSNLPPRMVRLQQAIGRLEDVAEGGLSASPVYETPPVGPAGQGAYLNQVVRFQTRLGPEKLLAQLKAFESELGRQQRGRWEAREIDLDLLAMDDLVQDTGRPLLPHPEIARRQFVLVPLCDLSPEWMHPVLKRTASELLAELRALEGHLHFPVVRMTEVNA